jgi:hypothetical protein
VPRRNYPELALATHLDSKPDFPASCPSCDAPRVPTALQPEHGGGHYRCCHYKCGGAYTYKPQIQNHTDKWWGVCPAA